MLHRVRFGIVSDPHYSPADVAPYEWQNMVDLPHSAELLDAALQWVEKQQVDSLVLLGDLTESADTESFMAVRERVLALGLPVVAVPGNCDVDPGDRSLRGFQGITGDSWTIAPSILLLDAAGSIELIGVAGEPLSKRLRSERVSQAHVSGSEMAVVFTHYSVLDLESELVAAGFRHSGNLTDRAQVETSLRAMGLPAVVVHGHLHIHDAHISGSILHLSCAALIEPPHHVSTIEVTFAPDQVVVERHAHSVRNDVVERLPVFAPEDGRWVWYGLEWSAE